MSVRSALAALIRGPQPDYKAINAAAIPFHATGAGGRGYTWDGPLPSTRINYLEEALPLTDVAPIFPTQHEENSTLRHTISPRQHTLRHDTRYVGGAYFTYLFLGQLGGPRGLSTQDALRANSAVVPCPLCEQTQALRVLLVTRTRRVFEVSCGVVRLTAVFVVDFPLWWARANEYGSYYSMNHRAAFCTVPRETHFQVPAGYRCPQDSPWFAVARGCIAAYAAKTGHAVNAVVSRNRAPFLRVGGILSVHLTSLLCRLEGAIPRSLTAARGLPLELYPNWGVS